MLDVLLVEDDDDTRAPIADALDREGHRVTQARDGEEAISLAEESRFDVAICDIHLPKMDGLAVFRRLRRDSPATAVVLMTSFAAVRDVVGTLRDGALDYVTKPFDPDDFAITVIRPLAERRLLQKRFETARAEWVGRSSGVRVAAASPAMHSVIARLRTIAQSDAAVLLEGESGAGKKTLARLLHEESPRRGGPFHVVPCASLSGVMLESELGDLASGTGRRDAWFRGAEGGTLVLDGIEGLPLAAQASLLRVLDEPDAIASRSQRWTPLGVRIVATSHSDLSRPIAEGSFLEPLYFRLATVIARVPSLRERVGDLLPLSAQLLARLTPRARAAPTIEPSAWEALSQYPFPGNVTELQWALDHALCMASSSSIEVFHLPERIAAWATPANT